MLLARLLAAFICAISCCFASGPLELRYNAPATDWQSQALPIGNGSMGAMIYGSPYQERIQFNDISLWTGGANLSGGYDVNSFGCYQNFGDLYLGDGIATVTNPSAASHSYPNTAQMVDKSVDGTNNKWCLVHNNANVIWQCTYATPATITGYTIKSAEDVPQRDPKTWLFLGSNDGTNWTQLDSRSLGAATTPAWPFPGRNANYSFTPTTTGSYKHYRFVFTPYTGVPHFQLAEITLAGAPAAPTPSNLARVLDLNDATHTVTWSNSGVNFSRETIASFPHKVLATRFTADTPGSISTTISLVGAHSETTNATSNELSFSATLSNNGLRYATRVRVIASGGTLTADAGILRAINCDSLVILHAAATDYAMNATTTPAFRSGVDPATVVSARLDAAQTAGYDTIKAAHLADYHALFNRATLDLGAPPAQSLTDARLSAYKAGGTDPHLEAMMFHFGRYLMISSSRDSLPANLQGLWNNSNNPPWFADYHTNINIQMNYWMAESTNLSECHLPLFQYLEAIEPLSRAATKASFGATKPGWTMRTSVNPFGGHGWEWDMPSSAWLARHYWEHYHFTGDLAFLEDTAWPTLKEICQFWMDRLITDANGKLVAPDSWSPEHGPRHENGVSYDQEIVWDLFTNTIAAEEVLGNDPAFRAQLLDYRSRLLVPAIGPQGQITEWANPTTEATYGYGTSNHRHTSHLFAVYPGFQFNSTDLPSYVDAAKLSLTDRGTSGDSRQSWTWPWRAAMWARLGEPTKAYDMVKGLLTYNSFNNLFAFANGPVYQIDGNLGMPAAITEMLLQSHTGEISILPGLPAAWPNGSFTGLRARNGFEVDASWQNGNATSVHVRSLNGGTTKVRLPALASSPGAFVRSGDTVRSVTKQSGTLSFSTTAGADYSIDTNVSNNADEDGDGFTTYQEWIAGTDPEKATSCLKLEIEKTGEGKQARWQEISQRKYILQHSTNLTQWTDLTTRTPQSDGTATFPLPESESGFYRLVVSPVN